MARNIITNPLNLSSGAGGNPSPSLKRHLKIMKYVISVKNSIGTKCYISKLLPRIRFVERISLAYRMNKEEAKQTAIELIEFEYDIIIERINS